MISSAGACERNWSTYDFIHCKKRNRLTPERANDLVFVFTNLQLAAKFRQPEKFAEWVTEVNVEEQQALMNEAKALHVSEPESDELLDIAQGVEQDEDFYDGCESE
jgi:hypothetical protein